MEVMFSKCPVCGKKDFRYRLKTIDYVCNKCGHVWTKELKEEGEE